jgi:hypothetical protein
MGDSLFRMSTAAFPKGKNDLLPSVRRVRSSSEPPCAAELSLNEAFTRAA